ncbi:MAG: hypothetical protein ACI88A_001702 [Paraglaciecola sp.]|jgi:uncharacterized protein involved in response to NO
MLNISDTKQEQSITPLLRLGFRPFFLFGGVFACVAMLLWILTLTGILAFSPFINALWWHSHEMLFGFVPAIIVGFLLTAVQTWTGVPGIRSTQLLLVFSLWALARILLAINWSLPMPLVMAIDLAFLPLAAWYLARPIFALKQFRNMFFVPLLLAMTLANSFSYLPAMGFDAKWLQQGFYGMLLLVTMLVLVLGGRVIPLFTANGTGSTKVLPLRWLEISAIGSVVLSMLVFLLGISLPSYVVAALFSLAAITNLVRCLRWRVWITMAVPLLWSLHLAFLFIPLGLGLIALHFSLDLLPLSSAIHALTTGGIGGMILAMMARVSLGHTGRKLQVGILIESAFVALLLAAFIRSVGLAIFPQFSIQLWIISALCWSLAFGLFVIVYWPILSSARADGRAG